MNLSGSRRATVRDLFPLSIVPIKSLTCHFSKWIFSFHPIDCRQWSNCRISYGSNMAVPARWRLCVPLVVLLYNLVSAQNVFRSFQYKYSFKPPYLAQKDGSVPFWEYSGSKLSYPCCHSSRKTFSLIQSFIFRCNCQRGNGSCHPFPKEPER